ncbi:MAG TPA: tetratricopeptide repeat protein [Kofleriaceae bacterium]
MIDRAGPAGRLPFAFHALGGAARLELADVPAGPLVVERLELEVAELGTDPGSGHAERYQRRRTRLRSLAVRVPAATLDDRVAQSRRHLAGLGITNVGARLADGYVSVRARAADGLATADVTFRIQVANTGTHLRALASHVRVHGHLPSPGPVIADRILTALLGATDAAGVIERPHARGLCDVEIDLIGALLWSLLPPAGWRLPAVAEVELTAVRIGRGAIEVAFGPAGSRSAEPPVRAAPLQLAAAHDLMHSADSQLREGHVEDAMRGYRALLAAGGPDQPMLLERILALAAARPSWFFDGLELARQALGRWPQFAAAHAALASITLAQGDAREAAAHLTDVAQLASADDDADQATFAALAGARLLRVLEPRAATRLYELALEHDPHSVEAADALADRLTDEARWPELVRLLRARALPNTDVPRAVSLRLRLAELFANQLGDPTSAHAELAVARALAPDDPAVHEMTAAITAASDPDAAVQAWREVVRLAQTRGDRAMTARGNAALGELLARQHDGEAAEHAWHAALEHDPLQADAIAGLAGAAAARGEHGRAAELYERLRGLGLTQAIATKHELALARSLIELGRSDDARAALRRATAAGGETSAEAHAVLAELAEAAGDAEHAAAELDTAIQALVELGAGRARAAALAAARATLLDRIAPADAPGAWQLAYDLARTSAPEIARAAARSLLASAPDLAGELRWIDAVLEAKPGAAERAALLVARAGVRRRAPDPDLARALADAREALKLAGDGEVETRRRALELEADVLATTGDHRGRAQALAQLALMAGRGTERAIVETAAASAWLAADDAAAALPHGLRALSEIDDDATSHVRRDVLATLGEAAWRQRAWPDVIGTYTSLLDATSGDRDAIALREGVVRYRIAVAAERTGDGERAMTALRPLADDVELARATPVELRGQALRLFADLAERAGDLAGAANALEGVSREAGSDGAANASGRADAMYRAGELFRRADRPDDAVRCLEAALRISDTHLPALDALEAQWRERGDLERVSVILGRKVAATARHPQRQKPLLSRLGDLQDQLGRPDVALATHQRALEIDATWRPSLAYVTERLRRDGQIGPAVGGLAQLAGELPGDNGLDFAVVTRDRAMAAHALAELVEAQSDDILDVVRGVAMPVLERAAADPALRGPEAGESEHIAAALARLRGEPAPRPGDNDAENTESGRMRGRHSGALSLRDAAKRARAGGRLVDAFAALETANHVAPGDPELVRELAELAIELGDFDAAARFLADLARLSTGSKQGDALLELADLYYDRLDDVQRARQTMREAAEAFTGTRHDNTLRLLAAETAAHLAWDLAVAATSAIDVDRRTATDVVNLATALVRAGQTAEAVALVEQATSSGKLADGRELLDQLRAELARKSALAERDAAAAISGDAPADAAALLRAINDTTITQRDLQIAAIPANGAIAEGTAPQPSIIIAGTPVENSGALALAAAAADRDRLLAAHRQSPDDPAVLLALLAHLGDREPALRREILDAAAADSAGRAQAIALHELALAARADHDPIRASALWNKAYRVDPSYAPVWMPYADALAGADELELARELYEQIADCDAYPSERRAWAAERADALAQDDSIVSGEIGAGDQREPSGPVGEPVVEPVVDLAEARELADQAKWGEAIEAAERAATTDPMDREALELLEELYLEAGDITAASEAIGRQLVTTEEPSDRAILWRRRAKLYRDALGRDAEAYRCLKEAHACAPADPEIAYQLRTAAMVRGEWALVASLLYREIAAAHNPRDRGALHLELALIFAEKLGDAAQAQVNFEQALVFDPTIPAARAPLAKRYEQIGRRAEAARLYEEAATTARAADRGALLAAAARCRATVEDLPAEAGLAGRIEAAEAAGDNETALELAHQLWRIDPGNAVAFRAIASSLRLQGDLAALTELTTLMTAKTQSSDLRASAWLDVARLADELAKYVESARAYDLALIEEPGHTGALDARGNLAFRLADWATADLIYRDLGPGESVLGDDELALRRSIIAEQLGRDSEALARAQDAAAAAPNRRDLLVRVQELATRLGELDVALAAGQQAFALVPLDDDDQLVATRFSLVDLYRQVGDLDAAVAQLDRIVRDHPHHARAIEQLAEVHVARGDWATAARYLYQLVPLAPTPAERAERLYRLGEAVLVHLGDRDRADDVFLRASDLDPSHVPTLRRLLDVYWRADDPGALVEVAGQLAASSGGLSSSIAASSLAQALVAAALVGDTQLAGKLVSALGAEAPREIVVTLVELGQRGGTGGRDRARRFELASASTAVAELGHRGLIDLGALRAAASGTGVESAL